MRNCYCGGYWREIARGGEQSSGYSFKKGIAGSVGIILTVPLVAFFAAFLCGKKERPAAGPFPPVFSVGLGIRL